MLLAVGSGITAVIHHPGNAGAGKSAALFLPGAPAHGGAGGVASRPASSSQGRSPAHPASNGQANLVPKDAEQVVITANLSLRVGRAGFQHIVDQANVDTSADGGFVQSSTTDGATSQRPSGVLVLRVPSSRFEQLMRSVEALGTVQAATTQGEDVGGQLVDLTARITNLQSEQAALRQLMARTGSIPQILTVEDQLFSVEQQIEELQGQRTYLGNQVTYATLTVDLSTAAPPAPVHKSKAPQNAVLTAAKTALHNTAAFLHGVAIFLGEVSPAIIVLALAGLTLLWRRRRTRQSLPPATAT